MDELGIPPPQCQARRKAGFIDRFWAWFWQTDLDVFERCWHYKGHAEYNRDQPRLQMHECAAGYVWFSDSAKGES